MPQVPTEYLIQLPSVIDRAFDQRQEVTKAPPALLSERGFAGTPRGKVLLLGHEPSRCRFLCQRRTEFGKPPFERPSHGPNMVDQGAVEVEDHNSNLVHSTKSRKTLRTVNA